jgi:hypothetical protein
MSSLQKYPSSIDPGNNSLAGVGYSYASGGIDPDNIPTHNTKQLTFT